MLWRSNGRKAEFIKLGRLVKILSIPNLDGGMGVALD